MFRAAVAGDAPPERIAEAARRAGVDLVPLGRAAPEGIAGYVMNSFGPEPPRPATADLLDELPDVRIVVYLGQSLEPLDYAPLADLEELRRRDIPLATTPAGDAIAEAAIGLIVAGDLNLAAAVTDPALDVLCREADFISVHTADSAPAGLLGRQLLQAHDAVLVNTTSAPRVVDPGSLLEALRLGSLRRAIVEGTYPEPWQARLAALGLERFVPFPAYTSWDTPGARDTGWAQAIAALTAAATDRPVPFRSASSEPRTTRSTSCSGRRRSALTTFSVKDRVETCRSPPSTSSPLRRRPSSRSTRCDPGSSHTSGSPGPPRSWRACSTFRGNA